MEPKTKTRRLFFALWPDEPTRAALEQATRKAARASGGRPMSAANLHSTLVFLGSVPEDGLPGLVESVAAVRQARFKLTFDALEHWAKPQVLILRCGNPPAAVAELAGEL